MALQRPGGKGLELEEVLKAYFWQAGYFVIRGVPYIIDGDDITDIDLWLYERPAAATRRRLIVDIKNRKSPKASERIIWTKGLQAALGMDGAIVATTDKRTSIRRLSKALNITLLDGDAISKLTKSESLNSSSQISAEEINAAIKRVDESRRSFEWRQTISDARASMITSMGVQSINKNLAANAYFAAQAVYAQPRSEQAQTALRLVYHTASLAAISLDYALADQAFRSPDERRESIINSIRFGQSDATATVQTVRTAIGLARKYLDNGNASAKQIEYGFYADADRIPAEIIADYVSRVSASDSLFNAAREMERASFESELLSFDELSVEARSLLGVLLDFNGVSREKVALAWHREAKIRSSREVLSIEKTLDAGPLFKEKSIDLPPSEKKNEKEN